MMNLVQTIVTNHFQDINLLLKRKYRYYYTIRKTRKFLLFTFFLKPKTRHTLNAYPELEWILFSDLDEFIVPMKVRRMDSYLAGLADDISAVLMGATFFGCPNDETIPYNYSNYLEIMTWRGFEFSTSNGKTIGRVGKLLVIRDHYPVVWLDGYRTHYPHKGELRLNHYRQISWEANRTDCDRSFKFMNDLQLYRIWKDIPTKYPDDYSYVEFNGSKTR